MAQAQLMRLVATILVFIIGGGGAFLMVGLEPEINDDDDEPRFKEIIWLVLM